MNNCSQQGQWLKWESVMYLDVSWRKQLYLWDPDLLSFRTNAIHDTLPTPSNLHLWNKIDSPFCKLCQKAKGTLHHILNHCKFALEQGRYTWRHDQVLDTLSEAIKDVITFPAEKKQKKQWIKFVPEGQAMKNPQKKSTLQKEKILNAATDWQLLVDNINDTVVFPPTHSPDQSATGYGNMVR